MSTDAAGLGSYQKFQPGLCTSKQAPAEAPHPLTHSFLGDLLVVHICAGGGVQSSCGDMHTAHVSAASFTRTRPKDTIGRTEMVNTGDL